jgi:phosphatidylglycerophosphate synthase
MADEQASFREARRHLESILSRPEKKALVWIAARLPRWVSSDHLTALGLLSMLGAGCALALARALPWTPLTVPFFLLLNWFGDSLDGTVARVRGKQRPRYGFYVDHIVDAFSALFLLGGLALSGLMSPLYALGLLLAFYLLSIDSYLATYTIGKFKISYFMFGPTELRILLAAGLVYVYYRPVVKFAGGDWLLLDAGAAIAIPAMLIVAIASVARHTRQLYNLERV